MRSRSPTISYTAVLPWMSQVSSLEPAGRLPAASDTKTRWFSGGPVVGGGMGRPPFAALVIVAHISMSSFTLPGIFNATFSSSANCFIKFITG